jgi:amino acid transporter
VLPPVFARISISFAVPYVAVICLAVSSAVIAVVMYFTNLFSILILVGAVLEALIYTIAGICVIRLRRKQPQSARAFRIRGGLLFPVLTIIIFGLLAILASLGIGSSVLPGIPLVITIAIMALSSLYVFLVIPKLRAAAAARRATRRRRPPREAPSAEVG